MRLERLAARASPQDPAVLTKIAFVATIPLLHRTALLFSKHIVHGGSPGVRKAMARSLIAAYKLKREDEEFDAIGNPDHVRATWNEWIASL